MEVAITKLLVPNTQCQDFVLAGVLNEISPELINLIKEDRISPKPLLICSGGTSSRCADQGHWTLDLRDKYKSMNLLAGDIGGTKTLLGIYENNDTPKLIYKKSFFSFSLYFLIIISKHLLYQLTLCLLKTCIVYFLYNGYLLSSQKLLLCLDQ